MQELLEVKGKTGRYLMLTGCFISDGIGCPAWGTSNPGKIRFIGDCVGNITLKFEDGEAQIPCIIGYTTWLHGIWNESPAPFKGEFEDKEMSSLLKEALFVKGAFENEEKGKLLVDLGGKKLVSVSYKENPAKQATVVFDSAEIIDEVPADAKDFFETHTVSLAACGTPAKVAENIAKICHALHTFEEDFENAPAEFVPPTGDELAVHFSGNKIAEIATGNVYYNMKNLVERTDDDGFVHTTYKDAPSWRYDGFGPVIINANSYYDSFYSRDAARAIMTLNQYGHTDIAETGCNFGDKWAMYYPENGLKLGGKIVPGHFSVIPNKPLIYSTVLTKIGVPALCDDPDATGGWPTKYLFSKFGKDCINLGNQETDGHGLMMMAHYAVWSSKGKDAAYVKENWKYINEFANWIVWCYENPDLSFLKDDLIYGETEAAMNDYTLYSNFPCLLGMRGFIEMAKAIGKDAEAEKWTVYADRLENAILKSLSEGEGWNPKKHGFYHDPVMTFMADIYGYDLSDMPEKFVSRSKKSYKEDHAKTVVYGPYGASGIGYNHSMITQNALLMDMVEDYTALTEGLAKLSYAPRLPDPYLVPEGLSVDHSKGILRRQGDLGNLVQLAEGMKTYAIALGVSPKTGDTIKLMPRMPKGWNASAKNFKIQNTDATIDFDYVAPSSMNYSIHGETGAKSICVRFGPFALGTKTANVTLNGKSCSVDTFVSGDSEWAWVETAEF